MASSYPPHSSRSPTSNVPYRNIQPTYPYPSNALYDGRPPSIDSDESENDKDGDVAKEHGRHGLHVPANVDLGMDGRPAIRTPSPTPSEKIELAKTSVVDWKAMMHTKYWLRKEWTWYYVIFIVCFIAVVLFTVFHKQIVNWLKPAADWMHDLRFGWLIPIAILFIISFPPLFGHEIVAILCGLVWGLGIGFVIVAAGTFLGELGNFYAFKWCCSARGEKLEKTKPTYAYLARVVRDGGFKIALIARLSAIPGHFTTAVFSTCGMSVWTFCLAAFLSLPKQFITVYLGVALEQSEDGQSSTKDTIIKDVVLGVTTIITFGAMYYIYDQMNKAKPKVIQDRCRERKVKLELEQASRGLPYGNLAILDSTTSVSYNPAASYADIPLTSSAKYSQPTFHAPQPHRPARPPSVDGYAMSEHGYNGQPVSAPRTGYGYTASSGSLPMQHPTAPLQQTNPFADSARVDLRPPLPSEEQPQGVSYQRQAPPRGYGSPPPEAFGRQAQAQRFSPPPQESQAQPYDANVANPFVDPAPMPMPPYTSEGQTQYGHRETPTDATFYTAAAHSRQGIEEAMLEGRASPPSYTYTSTSH